MKHEESFQGDSSAGEPRRGFLTRASLGAMLAGLVGSYGVFAAMMARFLYPARPAARAWQFVAEVDAIRTGGSRLYQTPAGMNVTVTRQGEGRTAADFLALSSTCPHLGCSVHWEGHNNRFFCPCHNSLLKNPSGVEAA